MRAAILAGGKGTRIAAFYPDFPKPMIPLNGKPLLQHQIEMLAAQEIRDVTLIVGYRAEVIRSFFEDGARFGVSISYITEETPLGTGGALSLLPREDTFILFGDLYFDMDFRRMLSYHCHKQADITLFAHPNSHPYDSDVVVAESSGKVTAWKSKKDHGRGDLRNLVNAGIYLFSAGALPEGAAVRRDLEQDLILPKIRNSAVFAYRSTEWVKDMGTPERLEEVAHAVREGIPASRSLRNPQTAIFLDRDGTINVQDGYITRPEQLRLVDGAAEAIRSINRSQYLAICVTNQPVIARGDVSISELDAIHARLDSLLGESGAYLDDLLYCPHHPEKGFPGERPEYKIDCPCRKPKPGLLLKAAELYHIDLSRSYMVGDSWRDVEAGNAAGCTSILVTPELPLRDAVSKILRT